jgi:tRNA 2-thiouridine synthesizing protein D
VADSKTLTFLLMDPPYEDARSTTAFRLLDVAVRRGWCVNVFAYEGAVALPFAKQAPHANAVHGRSVEEENHPVPREWVRALMATARAHGGSLDWVNCGLCVDERGMGEAIEGVRRGSPADFWQMAERADNTLVIPTR